VTDPGLGLDSLIFWGFVAAWVVLLGMLLLVVLPRVVREGLRIFKRVMALVDDQTLAQALLRAEGDAGRITAALERIPALQTRALAAVDTIRTTPIVPPVLAGLIQRVKFEIRAFRHELR
jgi:hypothetical protein